MNKHINPEKRITNVDQMLIGRQYIFVQRGIGEITLTLGTLQAVDLRDYKHPRLFIAKQLDNYSSFMEYDDPSTTIEYSVIEGTEYNLPETKEYHGGVWDFTLENITRFVFMRSNFYKRDYRGMWDDASR